jgi:hypothetical protein
MPRYTYPLGRQWKVFGNLGVGWGLSFAGNDVTITQHYFYGRWTTYNDYSGLSRGQEIGVAAGIGLKYWHLTFETRYDKPFMAPNSLPSYRLYFLLGYIF